MSIRNALTTEERSHQFFNVKSPPKDRCFDRLLFTTCNRNTRFLIAVLVFFIVSPPALSQSCGPCERVTDLFRYSQLAERLGDQEDDDDEGSACASLLPMREPVSVPGRWSAEPYASVLQEVVGNQTDRETFVESSPGDEGREILRVGCRGSLVDLAAEIRFYRQQDIDADYVQLQVIGKPSQNSDTNWEIPVIRSDGIITLPGTRWSDQGWSDQRQVWSNLDGEDCVFPAAKYTLYAMCAQAQERGSDSRLRTDDNGHLTVVGHSLGGAVAQFIASSVPSSVTDGSWPRCPGVNAYAFGSIGITLPDGAQQPAVHGNLVSYTSGCDGLVQSFFPSKVQVGRLFTLSPTNSHSIDSIQEDLCDCLAGRDAHQFNDYDVPDRPPANELLCPPELGAGGA